MTLDSYIVREGLNTVENSVKIILDNLNLQPIAEIETKFIGENYGEDILEVIPDIDFESAKIYLSKAKFVGVRLDIFQNFDFVADLVKVGINPYIHIDKPLKKEEINKLKGSFKIKVYNLENFELEDIQELTSLGVELILCSEELNTSKQNLLKYKFFDWKIFFPKEKKKLDKFENCDTIKTCRFVLDKNGLFASLAHQKKQISVQDVNGFNFLNECENEIEYFYLYGRQQSRS
jgi:hypothetical protein